jgi:hypothetical protein
MTQTSSCKPWSSANTDDGSADIEDTSSDAPNSFFIFFTSKAKYLYVQDRFNNKATNQRLV